MKKTIQRLFALLLVMAMALSLLCANVWAEESGNADQSVQSTEASEAASSAEEELAPDEEVSAAEEAEAEADEAVEPQDETKWESNGVYYTLKNGHLDINGMFHEMDQTFTCRTDIESVTIRGLYHIPDHAFNGCTSLKSFFIAADGGNRSVLKSIGRHAFFGCTGLKGMLTEGSVYSPISLPSSLESIGDYAFYGCADVDFNFSTGTNLKSIGDYAFQGCSDLKRLYLLSSLEHVGQYAFEDCTGLKDVYMEEGLKSSVFQGEDGLEKAVFRGCTALSNIQLAGSLGSIYSGMLSGLPSLLGIRIPKGITSIGVSAFEGCTNLDNVEFPDTLQTIDITAFQNCPKLKEVNLPKSVTKIWHFALGYRDISTKVDGFTIYGYGGTEAESYAAGNGFKFVDQTVLPKTRLTSAKPGKKGVLKVKWNAQSTGNGYHLAYSTDKKFIKNTEYQYFRRSTTTSTTLTGLKKGTYYLKICTVGKNGKESEWSDTRKVKVTNGYDLSMTKLTSVKGKKGQLVVQWKKNSSGGGYEIHYSTDKNFKKKVEGILISKNSATKYTIKNLKKGKYYVRIRTTGGTVSRRKYSAWSGSKNSKVS